MSQINVRNPNSAGSDTTLAADPAEKNLVRSLAKGFAVLRAFTAERDELALAEVAREAGIDNATAFRSLNTVVMHLVTPNLPFDPTSDLDVVARTGIAPLVMVMTPGRPQTTVAEVIGAAKAKPAEWTFAITSVGSAGHLATIEFNRRSGAHIEMAPYRGTQPALTDIIAGNVQLLIDPAFALLPAARAGRAKALGIASARRSQLAPELPTMSESGLGDFVFNSWYGIWAPKGTSAEIKGRVNTLMADAMREAETRQWLTSRLVEPVTESAEEARAFMISEEKRARELLASVNFKPA